MPSYFVGRRIENPVEAYSEKDLRRYASPKLGSLCLQWQQPVLIPALFFVHSPFQIPWYVSSAATTSGEVR